MPEVSNGGVRVVYDVVGQGRPLMLLHGWSGDRSLWTVAGYVEELSRAYGLERRRGEGLERLLPWAWRPGDSRLSRLPERCKGQASRAEAASGRT